MLQLVKQPEQHPNLQLFLGTLDRVQDLEQG